MWGLKVPVLVDALDARQAPIRYLIAVEAAFRAALGADEGFAGLITKNPSHPLWQTLKGPRMDYELGELAEWVDIPKHLPKRKPEEIGLGRNVALFDWLRKVAYRKIRHFKQDVRNYVLWQAHLHGQGLERNGDFRTPLDSREVWHVAKSVSRWTWGKFDLTESDARFSERQANRGRNGGKVGMEARWGNNENKRASAKLMAAQGYTQKRIAEELQISQQTISNWLKATPS